MCRWTVISFMYIFPLIHMVVYMSAEKRSNGWLNSFDTFPTDPEVKPFINSTLFLFPSCMITERSQTWKFDTNTQYLNCSAQDKY